MPILTLSNIWHQYDYWNCPTDVVMYHKSGERRRIWNGRVNQKGLKKYSKSERQQIIDDWKKWREDNGSFDFMHGADACGPTAMGMVLNVLGEGITQKKIVHAKHTLAYWPKGDPDAGKSWTKMKHQWNVGGRSDGVVSGKKYLRIDSANPDKLIRMSKFLLGPDKASKYEWINKGKGGFSSQDDAFNFIKGCIDGGYPLIVSYIKGPCNSIESKNQKNNIKLQGSGGHYVVILGYDDDHITIADPACGKEEKVLKNRVLEAPRRFSVYSGSEKKYVAQPQDFDGGFMAAWERRGYAYVLVKPKKGSKPAKESGVILSSSPIKVSEKEPLASVKGESQSVGEKITTLKAVQQRLAVLLRKDGTDVYYTDELDGVYGKNTKNAVKAFQKDHGMKVDGIPGPKTKKELERIWNEFIAAEAAVTEEAIIPDSAVENAEPGEFLHGRWSTGFAKVGDTVKIYLETDNFEDGAEVKVEVWEKDWVGSDDKIKTVVGTVDDNEVEIPVILDKYDDEFGEFDNNEFYFIANAGGTRKEYSTILKVAIPG